ncbi:MAG TPA: NUDIX hydrolase [Acidimicrobiales bacterium]|nr:NUDIX hydrolase [Acidimicrobiales bacterium]
MTAGTAGAGPAGGDPGFRQLDESLIHQAWFISMVRAHFVDPHGTVFEREIVRHPGAVAVVAVTDDDAVLLVRQYRPAVDRWLYEIPAGTCDVDGEPEETTAHRELAEEVGQQATELTELTRCLNTPGFCDEVTTIFLGTGLTEVADNRQGIEEHFMTVAKVPLDRFDGLVDDGTIVDAATILGVGLARRRLAAGR